MTADKSRPLKDRTKAFALRVLKLAAALPDDPIGRVIKTQLVKSGTSVGANYRAAMRARSTADFVAKMGIVEEEADECLFWIEIIGEGGILPCASMADLYREGSEILVMVVSSIRTARKRK